MILGCDLDGCVFDFNSAIISNANAIYLPAAPIPSYDRSSFPTKWNYLNDYLTAEQVNDLWNRVHQNAYSFWYMLKPLEGAKAFLDELKDRKIDTIFITSRPGIGALKASQDALNDLGYSNAHVIISSNKDVEVKKHNVTHFIDDHVDNHIDVMQVTPQPKQYLMDQPWNRTFESDDIKRVRSLMEIFDETL